MIDITSLHLGQHLGARLLLVTVLLSLAPLSFAVAQTPPIRLPTPAEQVRPEERALPPAAPLPPAPPPGVVVRPLGGAEAPPGAEAVTITLNAILLDGATVYPADVLAPAVAGGGSDRDGALRVTAAVSSTARLRLD